MSKEKRITYDELAKKILALPEDQRDYYVMVDVAGHVHEMTGFETVDGDELGDGPIPLIVVDE